MKKSIFEIDLLRLKDAFLVPESPNRLDDIEDSKSYFENQQNSAWLKFIIGRLNSGKSCVVVPANWPFKELWERFYEANQHAIQSSKSLYLASSGVSGRPKLIELTSEVITKRLAQYATFYNDKIENVLCFLPLSFGHGLIANTLGPLSLNKNVFISPVLDLSTWANLKDLIEMLDIQAFSCVPSHIRMMKKIFNENISFKNLEIHCASSPLLSSDYNDLKQLFPNSTLKYHFGMTELCSWVSMKTYHIQNDSFEPFNVGKILQLEAKKNLNNEIEFNLDFGFRTIDLLNQRWSEHPANSFFNSLDCGFVNRNELHITGRNSDFINKAGFKVSPYVIEEALKSKWPDFDFFALSTVSDGYGEDIFILAHPIYKKTTKIENPELIQISQLMREKLGAIYVPRKFKIIEEVQTNSNGKISRLMLKKWLKENKFE